MSEHPANDPGQTLAVPGQVDALPPGNPDALVRMGKRLFSNDAGMAQENVRAFELFLQAAGAGHAEAQHLVSKCYVNGSGVGQDLLAFLEWREKAAHSGSADAQYALGDNYHHARLLVKQDYAEAVKWWRLAAEQGHAAAQNDLGHCFKYGHGVPQNHVEAVKWFRKPEQPPSDSNEDYKDAFYAVGTLVFVEPIQ